MSQTVDLKIKFKYILDSQLKTRLVHDKLMFYCDAIEEDELDIELTKCIEEELKNFEGYVIDEGMYRQLKTKIVYVIGDVEEIDEKFGLKEILQSRMKYVEVWVRKNCKEDEEEVKEPSKKKARLE